MADKNHDHIRRLREEANTIRKQEQAKRRRNRVLTQIGIIVGAIVVIGAIVALVIFGPQWFNPRPTFEAQGTVPVASTVTGESTDVPIVTTERGAMIGDPAAPVTVTYWYDYSCGHCIDYHAQVGWVYTDLIATGQVKVEYVPINYVSPYGAQAGGAILAVLQHAPERYFEVSDAIFSIPAQQQSSWQGPDYAQLVQQLGVTDPTTIEAVRSGAYVRLVGESTRNARAEQVLGTPSIAINGQILPEIPLPDALYDQVIAAGAAIEKPGALGATPPAETPAG